MQHLLHVKPSATGTAFQRSTYTQCLLDDFREAQFKQDYNYLERFLLMATLNIKFLLLHRLMLWISFILAHQSLCFLF